MKPFETLAEMWAGFANAVIPAGASPEQIRDTRRAFYGGAWVIFTRVSFLAEDAVTEKEAVRRMQAWQAESLAFCDLVKQGKA